MGFPPYIRRILRSYLGGRVLHLCEDDRGIPVTMEATCGVPQGSVLGPLLWNVAYDAVFRLPMPRETATIGYSDDTLVVAEGDSVYEMQERANAVLETVADAILDLGLRLAVEKTQAVVFTKRYGPADPLILLEGKAVRLGASLKYLGIVFERKGTMFGVYLRAAAEKAQRVMGALGRLMPNVGGPGVCSRASYIPCYCTALRHGLPLRSVTLGTLVSWRPPNGGRP